MALVVRIQLIGLALVLFFLGLALTRGTIFGSPLIDTFATGALAGWMMGLFHGALLKQWQYHVQCKE